MRILIITAFSEGGGGGTGRVAYDMAKAFSQEHEVALVCPANETGVIKRKPNLIIYGIKSYISKKGGKVSFSWWSPQNKKKFYSFIERFRPEIIHSHQPINIDTVALRYAVKHSIPFFYTGHVLPSKALMFFLPGRIAKPVNKALNKAILKSYFKSYFKFCDGIVTLNKSSYEDHKKVARCDKLYVIPNGKDLRRFYTRNHPSIGKGEVRLLFVGYLSKRKNQEFLLEVMKHLPHNYKLILVGPPLYKGYEKKLRKMIKHLQLKNVELLGAVPHEKMPEIYEKAHIFVSAATLEVQSLVVIEALASGTPVVGLSNETIDEVIVDGVNGYRLPKSASPEEFAEKIKEIASLSKEEYEKMCENAYESSRVFDWHNVIEKTIEMYNEARREHESKQERIKKRTLIELNSLVAANMILFSFLYFVANIPSFVKKVIKRRNL